MIISDMLISGSVRIPLKKAITKAISFIFGTSENGSFAVLLGLVCGFPIGAKSALRLYGESRISHTELCHIMSFCNIPSPAFVCGAVGVMFHEREEWTAIEADYNTLKTMLIEK